MSLTSAQKKAVQQIETRIIEEVGADAVVIIFSKTKKNSTTTHLHTWGNGLACRGLAEEAYAHLCEGEDELEVEDEDESEEPDA